MRDEPKFLPAACTPEQEYAIYFDAGVDGLFRLLPDGTCERGLAILEVHEGGPQVIDPAPSSFTTASSY